MAVRTTNRQTADTNLPGVRTWYETSPPFGVSASDSYFVFGAGTDNYLFFYCYRDTVLDEVKYVMKTNATGAAVCKITYYPSDSVTTDADDGIETGIVLNISPTADEQTTLTGVRSDGLAPVIPADSWVALEWSGTIAAVDQLVVSVRCRETDIV
jgi:hypothetical protein